VHLWVEATWEVLIACIMALALMQLLGTSRRIVETWLYIEVALVLGTGILGLGHHYFWIGTPSYWLAIGGLFSALEPLPLLGMVVHAIYDAGTHRMKATNLPAFYWMLAEAFGNFLGAGAWGFMITLPQINLYAHGTQWTVSHGHFAFWGAYACGILSVIYLALQKVRGLSVVDGALWKWSFAALNIGMIGGQENQWFVEGMVTRVVFGLVFAAGYFALVWDLATLGKRLPVLATLKAAE
jgi:nitric oxide reductase subunit B